MSYILEALKKAEQRGDEGDVPHLLSYQGASEHKRGPLWAYLLVAALLLNAGMIFWWAHSWWSEERQEAVQAPSIHASVPAAPAEPPGKTIGPNRPNDMQEVPRETPVNKPQVPALRKEGRDSPLLSDNRKTGPATGTPIQPETRTEKRPTSHTRVFRLPELPSTVRSSLPAFRVSGHAYSPDPGSRVARINEQVLQEGQSIAPGLKVEEITPDGIVLSSQGYRFQIEINAN
jgi:general secretion pathway protein B